MKTNFKKLFVSILACISILPSTSLKMAAIEEPVEIVNINSAQDWLDIAERIRQNTYYSVRKHFTLNNDIVLDGSGTWQRICWGSLCGLLDGNGHTITITVTGSEVPCVIDVISLDGMMQNVNFSSPNSVVFCNNGLIAHCNYSAPASVSSSTSFVYVNNKWQILNCSCSGDFIAHNNGGTIDNCMLYINAARITELELGEPDEHLGSDDIWASANVQRSVVNLNNNHVLYQSQRFERFHKTGNISNCRVVHHNPQHN